MTDFTIEMGDRMRELLRRFKLPTFADQIVRRFSDAGHDAALPTLLEVLEAEADERKQRRTDRFRKMALLPPGKTLDSLDRAAYKRTTSCDFL